MAFQFSNIGGSSSVQQKGLAWSFPKDPTEAAKTGRYVHLSSARNEGGKKHLVFNMSTSWNRTNRASTKAGKAPQRATFDDMFIDYIYVNTAQGPIQMPVRVAITENDFRRWYPSFQSLVQQAGWQLMRSAEQMIAGTYSADNIPRDGIYSVRILYGDAYAARLANWNALSYEQRVEQGTPGLTAQEQAALDAALQNPGSPQSLAEASANRDVAVRAEVDAAKIKAGRAPAKEVKNYTVDSLVTVAEAMNKAWEKYGKSSVKKAGEKKGARNIVETVRRLLEEANTHFLDVTNVIDEKQQADVVDVNVARKVARVKTTKGKESNVLTEKYQQFVMPINGVNVTLASRATDGRNARRFAYVIQAIGLYTPDVDNAIRNFFIQYEERRAFIPPQQQQQQQPMQQPAQQQFMQQPAQQPIGGQFTAVSPTRQ